MYQIKRIDQKVAFEDIKYINKWENSNYLPTPYKRITKSEFEFEYFSNVCQYEENRQGYVGKSNKWHNMKIYYYVHMALAIVYNWNGKTYTKKYYKLGCEHNFIKIDGDAFETVLKCNKCGIEVIVCMGK